MATVQCISRLEHGKSSPNASITSHFIANVRFCFLGYCSSAITKLFLSYEDNPRALKKYMGVLQINTPPPLAASAQRPDREEAIASFVSRYNRSTIIDKSSWEGYVN